MDSAGLSLAQSEEPLWNGSKMGFQRAYGVSHEFVFAHGDGGSHWKRFSSGSPEAEGNS